MTVYHPRLCIACFRAEEARIDAEYEEEKANLENEIDRIDERFMDWGRGDAAARRRLSVYRAECENDILQLRAGRDLEIRRFRRSQGVWGDG